MDASVPAPADPLPFSSGTAILAPGREAPFLHRHPWIFSGAVRSLPGDLADGDEVEVRTAEGQFVARGLLNRRSQIRIRLYTWDEGETLDASFWRGRIARALELRRRSPAAAAGAVARREVFSEADGLSGLVVDRYADWLVLQVTSLALVRRLDILLDALWGLAGPRGILLRVDPRMAELEGMELEDGLLRGERPPSPLEIEENGVLFGADLRAGQKTGLYLDQRENRARIARLAADRRAADLFCYTGGFGLCMARKGAGRVDAVDSSGPALDRARKNARRNGVADRMTFTEGDVFDWLEKQKSRGARYGIVVLDPPRFASSQKDVPEALQAYRRLNRLGLEVLEPGGILATFSCSGRVGRDDFLRAVSGAGAGAGRHLRVMESLGHPPDHPVAPACPETEYLKGFVIHVD